MWLCVTFESCFLDTYQDHQYFAMAWLLVRKTSLLCNLRAWEEANKHVTRWWKMYQTIESNTTVSSATTVIRSTIMDWLYFHTHTYTHKSKQTCSPEIKKSNVIRYVHEKNVNDWARDDEKLLLLGPITLKEKPIISLTKVHEHAL